MLWPNADERHHFGAINWYYVGCMGIIDDMLMESRRMWENALHSQLL